MAKMKVKMVSLRHLKDGTRFWAIRNDNRRLKWEGKVCYQCIDTTKVWVFDAGIPIYANKDRKVFVEVTSD